MEDNNLEKEEQEITEEKVNVEAEEAEEVKEAIEIEEAPKVKKEKKIKKLGFFGFLFGNLIDLIAILFLSMIGLLLTGLVLKALGILCKG